MNTATGGWPKVATLALGLAALLLSLWHTEQAAATTTNTAEVELECKASTSGRYVLATYVYSGFSPLNSLEAEQALELSTGAAAGSLHSFQGPGSTDTLRLPIGSRTVTATATTVVRGGAGRVKAEASATVTCPGTPPPPPDRVRPSASFWGPCGDPYYRAVLDNRRSTVRVKFVVRASTFRHPHWRHEVWVRAGERKRTGLFDAAGGTRMTIRGGGELLASRRAAPNRMYKPCPSGVPIISR
jgi:hypothetical protein